jgi:hypothetical protein
MAKPSGPGRSILILHRSYFYIDVGATLEGGAAIPKAAAVPVQPCSLVGREPHSTQRLYFSREF